MEEIGDIIDFEQKELNFSHVPKVSKEVEGGRFLHAQGQTIERVVLCF